MMALQRGLSAIPLLIPTLIGFSPGLVRLLECGRVVEEAALPADEDADLMVRVAAGDQKAMRVLFDRWKRPLISFFYRSIPNMADAEDLTLTVFERLHRAASRYRPSARFSTYLFQIARRLLLNEYRRRGRKPLVLIDPGTLDYQENEADSGRRLAELEEVFQLALRELPEMQRTALLLQAQQSMDQAEAAEVMGVSPGAYRVLVHRGRRAIKDRMEALS